MNNQMDEIISNNEVSLYDYWKVFAKRKKIFLSLFFVPLVMVIIITLLMPRYYIGESEISIPELPALPVSGAPSAITAANIAALIGPIDDAKKNKIFASNSGLIKDVSISLPKNSIDKINIIINAKSADVIPKSFNDIIDYINALPMIKEDIKKIQDAKDLKAERDIEATDFKIKKLIESRKENIDFFNDMSDMIKKRKLTYLNINPADLIRKDGDLALEITNLQNEKEEMIKKKELNIKITAGKFGLPFITKQPTNAKLRNIILITGLLSLVMSIFVVFFLDYVERMKAREDK